MSGSSSQPGRRYRGFYPTDNSCIRRYMTEYEEKYTTAFVLAAAHVERECREALKTNEILAEVSARVKDPRRLFPKLVTMNNEKSFTSVSDIDDRIMDVIGVRVKIYFPDPLENVVRILKERFANVKDFDPKPIPDKIPLSAEDILKKLSAEKLLNGLPTTQPIKIEELTTGELEKYNNTYGNYRAVHLRFTLGTEILDEGLKSQLGQRLLKVEVQIQTVLLHAWSEVNHDVAYKELNGKPSKEELILLDCLNGVGKLGEHILLRTKNILDYRKAQIPRGAPQGALSAQDCKRVMRAALPQELVLPPAPVLKKPGLSKSDVNVSTTMNTEGSYLLGDIEAFLMFLEWVRGNNRQALDAEMAAWLKKKNTKDPVINTIFDNMLSKERFNEPDLSSSQPFLLAGHNDLFQKRKRPSPVDDYEVLAAVIDLTCRPIMQKHSGDPKVTNFLQDYTRLLGKNSELKLYDNAMPIMPTEFWPINLHELEDKKVIECLNNLAKGFNATQEPEYKYNLRIARIRAANFFLGDVLGLGPDKLAIGKPVAPVDQAPAKSIVRNNTQGQNQPVATGKSNERHAVLTLPPVNDKKPK